MFRFSVIVLVMLFSFAAADAQQRASIRAQAVENDTRFTAEFQAAMESGNYRQAAGLVSSGDATHHRASSHRRLTPITTARSSSSATTLAANTPPPDEADYTCNSGNCACAGASDCVAMAPICVEGTIGCNDYGCTCQEAAE